MNAQEILKILQAVEAGKLAPARALERLKNLPFEDLGFAKVDHHRALRQGFSEVIMGQGKEPEEIAAIVRALRRRKENVLVTRLSAKKMTLVKKRFSGLKYLSAAQAAT